jgi:hypothetical protein
LKIWVSYRNFRVLLLPSLLFLLTQSAAIPAGTRVEAKLESSVHTQTSKTGDPVMAALTHPISAKSEIVVPSGSRLNGRIETIQAASPTSGGRVRLVFREIEFPDGRRIPTWITSSFTASPPHRTRRAVIYTVVGATAGAFIGGKSARVAGILGGTLVGFVIAINHDGNLPDIRLKSGQTLQLELREDLSIP